jgi:hypothetical protein
MAAVVTAGFIATQGGGATQLDGPQGPALFAAQGKYLCTIIFIFSGADPATCGANA